MLTAVPVSLSLERNYEGFKEVVLKILLCSQNNCLGMVAMVYSTVNSLSIAPVFSFQQSTQPPLHHSVSFIIRNQELIPQNLTTMISVTLPILSLAAVGAAQSSIVSLFLNENFLELGPAPSLVGSIAGSVRELMFSHGPT